MVVVKPQDILHKVKLLQILTGIADNKILRQGLIFKGGTCAAMLGYLDRFSVDLDFDLKSETNKDEMRKELESVFAICGMKVKSRNENTLNFLLKYESRLGERNTMEFDALGLGCKFNKTRVVYLPEIERYLNCQTIETMFSNKLCAVMGRYAKHKKIAGRDIYDVRHFFTQGYHWLPEIIKELTGKNENEFITELIKFIEKRVGQQDLDEDLNGLLEYEKFKRVRLGLKQEVLLFLKNITIVAS